LSNNDDHISHVLLRGHSLFLCRLPIGRVTLDVPGAVSDLLPSSQTAGIRVSVESFIVLTGDTEYIDEDLHVYLLGSSREWFTRCWGVEGNISPSEMDAHGQLDIGILVIDMDQVEVVGADRSSDL
jgi:hypothetical protein